MPAATRPGVIRRLLFRLPLVLERHGAALLVRGATRLLGIDWIVLETIGRRSGARHTVMLDVVGRDVQRDVYYVQPAFGRTADWVRNTAAHPDVDGRVGERRFRAHVRDATGAEGAAVVLRFLRQHPRYARLIVWFVGYVDRVDRPDDELLRDLQRTPVFAIDVVSGPGMPRPDT